MESGLVQHIHHTAALLLENPQRDNDALLAWLLGPTPKIIYFSESNSNMGRNVRHPDSKSSWALVAHGKNISQRRGWLSHPRYLQCLMQADNQVLATKLGKRKIRNKEGPDILRWCHHPIGNFTLNEAYYLHVSHNLQNEQDIWKKILHSNQWPKITFFVWNILHKSILTWDNLLKWGFEGPTYFSLCN